MSHRNARLTPKSRALLVERVRHQGMPVAHVAKAMGISRQCAHRWVRRFDEEGLAGLEDRSSRPLHSPNATDPDVEAAVREARGRLRCGPQPLADETGVPARTVSRILARHGEPKLCQLDPMTGIVVRASRTTAVRYERERPGELVHVDVKKLGRIPDGGGWRALGREVASDTGAHKRARIGYDYVHSMVDDHSRLAYSEIHRDERGETCAGFLARAAAAFRDRGISQVERVMTDNAFSYRHSKAVREVLAALGARHVFIRPHCPWQNGKVERFNRTLQAEWAYRRVYRSNQERSEALDAWIECYNTVRNHSAIGGRPPISRVSPT